MYGSGMHGMGGGMGNMGGFMNDGGHSGSSPMKGGAGDRGGDRANAANKSIRAVTIRQILTNAPSDESFILDGAELSQLTLVGRLVAVEPQEGTFSQYRVDDGTGVIAVRVWLVEDEASHYMRNRQQFNEGIYVRIFGSVRTFNGERTITCHRMRPVTDSNEITFHYLDVIRTHIHFKQLAISGGSSSSTSSTSTSMSNHHSGAAAAGVGMGSSYAGFSPCQHEVLEFLNSKSSSEIGPSIVDIVKAMQMKGFRQDEVRESLKTLMEEAHIYSTIDDDHFKAAC